MHPDPPESRQLVPILHMCGDARVDVAKVAGKVAKVGKSHQKSFIVVQRWQTLLKVISISISI